MFKDKKILKIILSQHIYQLDQLVNFVCVWQFVDEIKVCVYMFSHE